MHRARSLIFSGMFTISVLAAGLVMVTSPVSAATLATTTACSNSVDNSGGLGLICEVSIVNTYTASGGSAKVTVRECHGAAGAPTAACSTTVRNLTRPVTAVTQCNGSINGGGGTLRCSVRVVNNFFGVRPGATAATVNQCVGSGGGITTGCDPFPATTTGAMITQCNGSANGGTLVGLTCTATGTKSSTRAISINQCNGSANGGGALVICSANVVNRVRAVSSGGGASSGPSSIPPPNTSTIDGLDARQSGIIALIPAGLALVSVLAMMAAISSRARSRS